MWKCFLTSTRAPVLRSTTDNYCTKILIIQFYWPHFFHFIVIFGFLCVFQRWSFWGCSWSLQDDGKPQTGAAETTEQTVDNWWPRFGEEQSQGQQLQMKIIVSCFYFPVETVFPPLEFSLFVRSVWTRFCKTTPGMLHWLLCEYANQTMLSKWLIPAITSFIFQTERACSCNYFVSLTVLLWYP